MNLSNEFTVAVPLERAWETLLDIEQVAGFLPGAKVEPNPDGGVYRGSMRVKLGPLVVDYEGTAELVRADAAEHCADIAVEASDIRGQGTASAVIRNRLFSYDGGTRVLAETDLTITGRHADFGRGLVEDIAKRILDDFARRFEQHLEADTGPTGETGAAGVGTTNGGGPIGGQGSEALDVGSVLWRTPSIRRAASGVLAALVLALILLSRRLRSSSG